MTLAEILYDVRRALAYDLDLSPSLDEDGQPIDATDADVAKSVNKALSELGKLAPIFDPSVALALTTAGFYDLAAPGVCSRRVYRVLDVVIGGLMLRNAAGTRPGPWSLSELEREHPAWRTDAAGTPRRWAHASDRAIVLHPRPDAGTVALANHFVSAHVLPAALDPEEPTGVPELPEELHHHVARLAAVYEAEAVATNGDQLAKCQMWKGEAFAAAQALGTRDRTAKAPLGSTSRRSKGGLLRMR